MKLTINGAGGVDQADLDIEARKVTLIAGRNADGKSSTLRAAQAVLGATPKLIELKEGHKTGVVRFESSAGIRTIDLPKCELKTQAGVGIVANDWALGLIKFMSLDAKERARSLTTWTQTKVTKARLEKELEGLKIDHKTVVSIAMTNGLEVAEEHCAAKGRELKAEFKVVTGGKQWGSDKGLSFTPDNWSPVLESLDVERIKEELALCQAELQDAIGKDAVAKKASEHAGKSHQYADEIADWTQKLDTFSKELIDVRKRLSESETGKMIEATCEDCGMVGHVDNGILKKGLSFVDDAWTKKLRDTESVLVQRIANAQLALGVAQANFKHAEAAGEVAAQAVDVQSFKTNVEKAEAALKAKQQKEDATRIHYELVDYLAAKAVLAPDGLARKVLDEALGLFNQHLMKTTAMAGWSPVTIDADLDLCYGGRKYRKLSKSEQLRSDTTLQVAVALKCGQEFIIVDELDMLDGQGRSDMLYLLRESRLTVLAAMTVIPQRGSDTLDIPDLEAMGLGRTYVINNGVAGGMVPA